MSNHTISNGKTLFDLFNMLNPNCYQAFIIQCIIENKKEEAIQYCNELSTAIEYYKWNIERKQSSYIDSLICESQFEKWQKIAIIYIISNDVNKCKEVIESEINKDKQIEKDRIEYAKKCRYGQCDPIQDLYELLGLKY